MHTMYIRLTGKCLSACTYMCVKVYIGVAPPMAALERSSTQSAQPHQHCVWQAELSSRTLSQYTMAPHGIPRGTHRQCLAIVASVLASWAPMRALAPIRNPKVQGYEFSPMPIDNAWQ